VVFKTGDDVFSSPAAAGDTVYIGSNDGKIYAVDTATGSGALAPADRR